MSKFAVHRAHNSRKRHTHKRKALHAYGKHAQIDKSKKYKRTMINFKTLMAVVAASTLTAFADEAQNQYTTDAAGHTLTQLPYQTSFDNSYNEYDGTTFIPRGWSQSGDTPFYTASTANIPAADGTYYAISQNNTGSRRNERLYTLFFHMLAGHTYTLSYSLWMPGLEVEVVAADGFGDREFRQPTFTLTAGLEQDYEFQTHKITEITKVTEGWQSVNSTFTPTEEGDYCFCFAFDSKDTYTGDVCLDNLLVSYDGAVLRPTADIAYTGLFSAMDGNLVVTEGGPTHFTALSQRATDYKWTVSDSQGNVVATYTDRDPDIYFPKDDTYTVKLNASNSKYTATASKTVIIDFIPENESYWAPFQTFSEKTVDRYETNTTPYFTTSLYDFVTGPNHHYMRFAERIDLPQHVSLSLQTLQYYLCSCTFASVQTGQVERTKPFTFTIYGEKDGKLDESNVIFQEKTVMEKAFSTNTSGLGNPTMMAQPLTGEVAGPFYVAFEFDPSLTLDTNGGNRTYVEMMANYRKDGKSTFYYYDKTSHDWQLIDTLHPGLAGTGLQLNIWGTINVGPVPEHVSTITTPSGLRMPTFNLQGQRTNANATHGIIIRDGQKILSK